MMATLKPFEEWGINLLNRIKSNLGIKVFIGIFSLLMFTFLICFIILRLALPVLYKQEFNRQFEMLLGELIKDLNHTPLEEMDEVIDAFSRKNNANVTLWNHQHEVIHQSKEMTYSKTSEIVNSNQLGIMVSINQENEEMRMGFSMEAKTSLDRVDQVTELVGRLLVPLFVMTMCISLISAFAYSKYLAKPIVRISQISRKMTQLDLKRHYDIERDDEIGELADNLNLMAEKLEKSLNALEVANQQLRKEMAFEREQEALRHNLFTAISHELKTPITILKGELGGMIDQVGIYKDRETYLQHAYETTEALEALVQEILMMTRIEESEFCLKFSPREVNLIVNDVCQTYETLGEQKKVDLTYYCEEELVAMIDETQFRKVVSNIINNAIMHSPSGEFVDVQLKCVDQLGILTVVNTGVSIQQEDLEQLFDPFYRADKSRNRHTGGSGLGLFIVKRILDLHGFSYEIANNEDGVIFTMKFPVVMEK